jgi:hypothetical protein
MTIQINKFANSQIRKLAKLHSCRVAKLMLWRSGRIDRPSILLPRLGSVAIAGESIRLGAMWEYA